MSGTRNKYQVVFLIDVSAGVPSGETDASADQIVPCICLSALRILTHLTSLGTTNHGRADMKWGFKFYNSLSRCIQKYQFNDFTVKDFEEFETRVDSVIESEKTKSHGLVKERFLRTISFSESENSRDCFASNRDISLDYDIDPVDKLQTALRDLVTDFQWDRPDICSPVRFIPRRSSVGRRRGQSLEYDEPRQHNLTFLFSRCPYSPATVASFAGVSEDAEPQDVLSSFLPTSLYRQFYESAKIRLFWVDLNADPCNTERIQNDKEFSFRGINQIHEALSMVGGGVLPTNALLQMGTYSSTPICGLLEVPTTPSSTTLHSYTDTPGRPGGLVLPVSTLLMWYLHDPFSGPLQRPSVFTAQLVINTGSHRVVFGEVELHSIVMPKEAEKNRSSTTGPLEHSERAELEISEEGNANANFSFTLEKHASSSCTSVRSGLPVSSPARPCTLHIRGTVSSGELPLECLRSDTVFTVKLPREAASMKFSHLLQELARKQLSLVVDSDCGHVRLPRLGVMQPLTADMATLTLIRSEVVASIEKILVFSNEVSVGDKVNIKRDGIKTFITKTIKHLCHSHREDSLDDNEGSDCAETVPTTNFHVNLLESWMTGAVQGMATDSIIQSLRNSEDHEKVEEVEVHALRAVQKLYHAVKYTRHSSRVNTATPKKKALASPRKTPTRKSPRKTPRKSPRKSFSQAAKRRTPRKTPKKRYTGTKGRAVGKVSHAGLGRSRSFTAPLSRTAMIIQRSQHMAAQVSEEDEGVGGAGVEPKGVTTRGRVGARANPAPSLPLKDMETEADLLEYMHTQYESGVTDDMTPLSCAQTMVSVGLHYFKTASSDKPEGATGTFFRKGLLKTTAQITETYAAGDVTSAGDMARLREYELQVVLRLELESLLSVMSRTDEDSQPTVQQVSSLLTRMTLLRDSVYVASFMRDTLLCNYADTTPRLLANIYEELLLPLPHELAGLFSDDDDDEASSRVSSVQPTSVRSDLGAGASCSNPGSNRSTRARRSLGTIPSFNVVTKRQIAVPAKAKIKDKEKKKIKKSGRGASVKKLKQSAGTKAAVKQVRRNLFMGGQSAAAKGAGKLERHKSVAVMESIGPKSPSTPNKRIQKLAVTTPKSHHILKTKKVTETPVHKQIRGVMWHRLEKERQRAHTVSDVNVVQESPDKVPFKGSNATLARRCSLGNIRQRSFYSNDPQSQSRNVVKYKQLEARMTNINPLMSPTREKPLQKCSPPRRIQPVNLFANLNSPSPPKMVHHHPPKPVPSTGLQSRIFSFDSPSKNTRNRSLFAPPEVEQPNTTPRKGLWESPRKRVNLHFDSVEPQAATSACGMSLTQPVRSSLRRATLQPFLVSPMKSTHQITLASPQKGFLGYGFMSPVKSHASGFHSIGLSTPVKNQSSTTPLKGSVPGTPHRTRSAVSPEFSTPHRSRTSQRILGSTSVFAETRTPSKKTPQKTVLSPSLSSQSPTRDHASMLNKWAQKALRQTPQRKAHSLSLTFAEFGSHDDTVPIDDLGLPSPPRKKMFHDSPSKNKTDVNLMLPRNSVQRRKSPRFSPTQEPLLSLSKVRQYMPEPSTSAAILNSSLPCTARKTAVESDSNSFTPPFAKAQKTAIDLTPSRKFKAGRITPEPTSPLDSWPRKKKPWATASPSVRCAKSDCLASRVTVEGSGDGNPVMEVMQSVAQSPSIADIGLTSASNSEDQASEVASRCLFSSQDSGLELESGVSCIDSQISKPACEALRNRITGSASRLKRKRRLDQGDHMGSDNMDFISSPSKRSRTVRGARCATTPLKREISVNYFDSQEVFISSSTVGSVKNSPTDNNHQSNPLRRIRSRLRRGCSAGSDSNSNLDADLPVSPVIGSTGKLSHRLETLLSSETGSDSDRSLPTSPVFKHSAGTPMTGERMSPASGMGTPSSVRNFSPGISAMSLVHLMQSPLVESAASASSSSKSSTSRPVRSSRRSLYRTQTNQDEEL